VSELRAVTVTVELLGAAATAMQLEFVSPARAVLDDGTVAGQAPFEVHP